MMKIGIIGGGVGGLTLALSLVKEGYRDIHIFESSKEISELGVGINILPHAMRIMDGLGLLESLVEASVETESLSYYTQKGQLILSDQRGVNAGYSWPQISIHRSALIQILYSAVIEELGKEKIHTDCRLTGFESQPGTPVIASFSERNEEFDLLVGCDGIHSEVRKTMYPNEGAPKWDGITMWRGVSWMPASSVFESMIIAGKSEHRMVMYPIKKEPDGQYLVNWVAKHKTSSAQEMPRQDWVHKVDKREIPEHFNNFEFLKISELIAKSEAIYKYPQVDRDPLPAWHYNNVTLLGDAAHPMYPSGSNGASQAILDCESFVCSLKEEKDLGAALTRYEEERRTATSEIVLKNRKAGPERCIDVVEERAPNGFDDISQVISKDELESILQDYKKVAGFDRNTLGNFKRPVSA